MYDNEYGNINTSSTPTGKAQGTGSYTDYVGYGSSGSSNGYSSYPNGEDRKKDKSKGKGKTIAGIVAILMAGILAGGGISYAFLNAQNSDNASQEAQAVIEDNSNDSAANESVQEEKQNDKVGLTQADGNVQEVSLPQTASDTNMTVAQITEKCMPSVVAITNTGETEIRSMWGNYVQQSQSAGSGVIIGETDDELLILTNYHVIEDNNTLSVVFSWEEDSDDADIITATVKDYDEGRDIAVISVNMNSLSNDTKSKITVATVGDSDALQLGEQIVAIGNALGYGQSVTTGIVSALNRSTVNSSSIGSANVYIQTDAPINPGNSGGAMFNMRVQLVGIISAHIGGTTVEGMGYAIPISEIFGNVENMMNQETRTVVDEANRGYLGISIVDVTSEISATYGLPQGIYISSIESGSGAEKAGMQEEQIITAVNGKTVSNSAGLKEYLSYYSKGETVTVTVQTRTDSGYESRDYEVVLGDNKSIN